MAWGTAWPTMILAYLLLRTADEKSLANQAGNDEARLTYKGMADAYEQKIRGADPALLIAAEMGLTTK